MATTVKTIARNPETCDFVVGPDKQLVLVEGKEAYAQIINAKMRTQRGELQLNLMGGIPYMETVFKNRSLIPIWESEVILMLEDLPFVKSVKNFEYTVEEGTVKYTAEIETDSGEITING